MKLDLTGKRAIITAGGAGIGRKTAEVFAAAGARIVICDIDSEAVDSARADIPGLSGAVCDVADAAALDAFLDDAIARLGGLAIMVNNAGTAGPTAPVEDVHLEDRTACPPGTMTRTFPSSPPGVPGLKWAGRTARNRGGE